MECTVTAVTRPPPRPTTPWSTGVLDDHVFAHQNLYIRTLAFGAHIFWARARTRLRPRVLKYFPGTQKVRLEISYSCLLSRLPPAAARVRVRRVCVWVMELGFPSASVIRHRRVCARAPWRGSIFEPMRRSQSIKCKLFDVRGMRVSVCVYVMCARVCLNRAPLRVCVCVYIRFEDAFYGPTLKYARSFRV